jgi:hypothetical protein
MPQYVAEPSVQTYPPFTIKAIVPGKNNYSWGTYTPYVDAPNLNVEHAEPMPANGTAGRQFSMRSYAAGQNNSPAITWEVEYPSAPATISIHLEGALRDIDAEYFQLDTSTNIAGDLRFVALGAASVNFLRIKVITSTGGTAPTIIAKFKV